MTSFLRFDRRLWLPVLLGASASACKVPGEDWVDPSQAGSTSGGSPAAVTMTAAGPVTSTSAAGVTSGGDGGSSTEGATATSGGDSGGSSATGDGGASSDTTSDTTGDDNTNDSSTDSGGGTTSDSGNETTNTTSSGDTGGVPDNSLIQNGDFSDGENGWELEGDASVDVSNGQYCMTLNNAGTLHLDWPTEFDPAPLQAGESYVFSYLVYYSGEEPTGVSVKLGQPVEPYNAFAEGPIDATTTPSTFMQTFDNDAEDTAGIRFTIDGPSGTKVCIDDVALVPE